MLIRDYPPLALDILEEKGDDPLGLSPRSRGPVTLEPGYQPEKTHFYHSLRTPASIITSASRKTLHRRPTNRPTNDPKTNQQEVNMKPSAHFHHLGAIRTIRIMLVEYAVLQAELFRNKQITTPKLTKTKELHQTQGTPN